MRSMYRTRLPIALQLWTVKDALEHDCAAALREARRIGYAAVELAGFAGRSATDMHRALDAAGLHAISAHIPLVELTERLPAVIADMHTINCPQVVLPWVPPEQRTTTEAVMRLAEQCNLIGARLAAHEIRFAYHNEDYDFLPLGESTLWHTLVAYTDPQFVALQVDVFTAILMGCDISALLQAFGARITSLHVCDMRERAYVPIGAGVIDWHAVRQATRITAVEWLIVEHDGSMNPFGDAAQSLSALQDLEFTLDRPKNLC